MGCNRFLIRISFLVALVLLSSGATATATCISTYGGEGKEPLPVTEKLKLYSNRLESDNVRRYTPEEVLYIRRREGYDDSLKDGSVGNQYRKLILFAQTGIADHLEMLYSKALPAGFEITNAIQAADAVMLESFQETMAFPEASPRTLIYFLADPSVHVQDSAGLKIDDGIATDVFLLWKLQSKLNRAWQERSQLFGTYRSFRNESGGFTSWTFADSIENGLETGDVKRLRDELSLPSEATSEQVLEAARTHLAWIRAWPDRFAKTSAKILELQHGILQRRGWKIDFVPSDPSKITEKGIQKGLWAFNRKSGPPGCCMGGCAGGCPYDYGFPASQKLGWRARRARSRLTLGPPPPTLQLYTLIGELRSILPSGSTSRPASNMLSIWLHLRK